MGREPLRMVPHGLLGATLSSAVRVLLVLVERAVN